MIHYHDLFQSARVMHPTSGDYCSEKAHSNSYRKCRFRKVTIWYFHMRRPRDYEC
jgi:hypothetical protein